MIRTVDRDDIIVDDEEERDRTVDYIMVDEEDSKDRKAITNVRYEEERDRTVLIEIISLWMKRIRRTGKR